MKLRGKIFLMCLIAVTIYGGAWVLLGQETAEAKKASFEAQGDYMQVPMGTIMIEPSGETEGGIAVDFPHALHFNYSCRDCHHKWEGESEVLSCRTSGCHDLNKSPEKPLVKGKYTAEGIRYSKYAYHELCIGCHKNISDEIEKRSKKVSLTKQDSSLMKTGPVACAKCHPKSEE